MRAIAPTVGGRSVALTVFTVRPVRSAYFGNVRNREPAGRPLALWDCVIQRHRAYVRLARTHQAPSVSPPGDLAPRELPTEDDSGDEVPAVVATSPAAAVWVVGASASPECCRPRICWPCTPSGPRTSG